MELTDSVAMKRADAQSYDPVAQMFDSLTDRFSESIATRMLQIGAVAAGSKVLDVGTGTGLIPRLAGELCGDVLGIDQSAGMLAQAEERASAARMTDRVRFAAMDAEALDLRASSFDVVLSLYVIRHLPNPDAAIAEMRRVLKPNGRAVIAVGARPRLTTIREFKEALGVGVDRLLEKAGCRAFSPDHLRRFLEEQGISLPHSQAAHKAVNVAALLKQAGFSGVRRHRWSKRYVLSPAEFWLVQSIFDSVAREALAALEPEASGQLKGRYLERLRKETTSGRVLVYRAGADIYSAEL